MPAQAILDDLRTDGIVPSLTPDGRGIALPAGRLNPAQRAAIAANGIDAGIGTPAEILGETALFGEVDQQAIRLNTARTAWGFNSQVRNIQNQAGIDRFNTRAKGTATVLSGISSIASSAGGFYG